MTALFSAIITLAFSFSALACPIKGQKKVNISVKDAKIGEVLEFLSKESKTKFNLASNFDLNKKVSLQVKGARMCDVYDFLTSESKP